MITRKWKRVPPGTLVYVVLWGVQGEFRWGEEGPFYSFPAAEDFLLRTGDELGGRMSWARIQEFVATGGNQYTFSQEYSQVGVGGGLDA